MPKSGIPGVNLDKLLIIYMDIDYLLAKAHPVPFSGCFILDHKTDKDGYVKLCVSKKQVRAHRLAYELANGPIQKGMLVCHHCGVRSCINPHHLFLGSHEENMKDMVKKLRSGFGERHSGSKLKASQILEIRSSMLPASKLALIYGVGHQTILDAKNFITWKSVAA